MVAFDSNFGESFHKNIEIFAMRMWQPINSVKLFTYDFAQRRIDEIYEIPISAKNLQEIQSIQLVRISDESNAYALLIDLNSYKEVYLIEFNVSLKKHKM